MITYIEFPDIPWLPDRHHLHWKTKHQQHLSFKDNVAYHTFWLLLPSQFTFQN